MPQLVAQDNLPVRITVASMLNRFVMAMTNAGMESRLMKRTAVSI